MRAMKDIMYGRARTLKSTPQLGGERCGGRHQLAGPLQERDGLPYYILADFTGSVDRILCLRGIAGGVTSSNLALAMTGSAHEGLEDGKMEWVEEAHADKIIGTTYFI